MSNIVIQVENLSKYYRLGLVGRTTLEDDIRRFWAKLRGKPDPTLKIGQEDKNNGDGYIWALSDVSFEVKQGEILGIIGRNGAGKSTLLKILSRVTAPTIGECRVKGRIASLLEVGTGFHPELAGRENIFLNGAILGMTKEEIKQKFDEIVTFAEVEKFIDTPVKRYSSGMYVRLAFAVAAHLDPDILVVDEVLAVGDAQFQKKCLAKMEDVGKQGRTVLFVSHNMGAIRSLTNRCLVIDRGEIAFDGKSGDAVNMYLEKSRTASENGYVQVKEKHREGVKKDLSKQVLFCSVELRDGKGERSSVFEEFAPMEIAVTFETFIICRRIELLFIIKTVEEIVVANLISDLIDVDLMPGVYSISCHIPRPNIAKGNYYITTYLLTGNRNPQDLLFNIIQFEIILNKSRAYSTREVNFSYGDIVRLANSWSSIEKVH